MSDYDWRNPAAYAYMREHEAEDFACEYLSRNEDFHREWVAAIGSPVLMATFVLKWGLRFHAAERPSN